MPLSQPVTAIHVAGPRLLVSVRDQLEAQAAMDGGADIIDVKDPGTGPLGFAGFDTISQIAELVGDRVPVSAALGECTDWLKTKPTGNSNPYKIPQTRLSHCPTLGKLGLAGLATPVEQPLECEFSSLLQQLRSSPSPWISGWQSVRLQLQNHLKIADQQPAASTGSPSNHLDFMGGATATGWVAVAYADFERAAAPDVWSVLAAGVLTGCSILLIDTFIKDGQGTLKWLDVKELQKIRSTAHQMGLMLALAGQLNEEHLPEVACIRPDILAVRGAVCTGKDRQAVVSADQVRKLQERLKLSALATSEHRD